MPSRPEVIPVEAAPVQLPLLTSRPFTGFANPGEDFIEQGLDLNAFLIHNYPVTYLFKAAGEAMTGAGIWEGDLLLVDRSKDVRLGDLVILILEGQFLLRRWTRQNDIVLLTAKHPGYQALVVTPETEVQVFAGIQPTGGEVQEE